MEQFVTDQHNQGEESQLEVAEKRTGRISDSHVGKK